MTKATRTLTVLLPADKTKIFGRFMCNETSGHGGHAHAAGSKWTAAWSQTDPAVWTSIYADEATYTDYAFGFTRRGKKGIEDHFKLWKVANPDFRATVIEAWPGLDLGDGLVKYSIRTSNVGTFTDDLPSLKASGKKFDFYAVVDLVIRVEDGLIVKIDEWYHRQIDASIMERDSGHIS